MEVKTVSTETNPAKDVAISEELSAFIAEWKDKPGNLIMVLHRVQTGIRLHSA